MVVFSLFEVVLVWVLVLPLFTPLFQALNPDADTIPYPTSAFLLDPNASRRGPGGDGKRGRDEFDLPVGVVWRWDMFLSYINEDEVDESRMDTNQISKKDRMRRRREKDDKMGYLLGGREMS
jgi:hypothetical protein